MFIEEHISKLNVRGRPRVIGPWSREDFEIREKEDPVNNSGVVIPGCEWPVVNPHRGEQDPRYWI
jgi:hypothetical protein